MSAVANVVVAQFNVLVVTAGSFVVTPAVLNGLGDSAYGGWLLINSFIGYTRLLDLGMSSGTVKYGAGAIGRGDHDDLKRVMNTSTVMFLGAGIATFVAAFAMAFVLPRIYPNVIANATETILILGAAMALDLVFRPFAAALRMRSLYFVYDGLELVSYTIFKLGLLLYFAKFKGLDYHTLALLTFGETGARLAFVAVSAMILNPASRKINPIRAERSMVRKLATMGAAVSIIQIADLVRFQFDSGVIGYMLPERTDGIAVFGVGTRLPSISYFVVGTIGSVLMPRFSGLDETSDRAGTIELLRKSNMMTGLACAFFFLNIAVLGPHFLELWLRKPWVHESGQILLVFVPAYYVASLTQPGVAMILGRGKLRGLTILTVVEALLNLVMSAALVRPLGLFGVALGTAIPLAFFRGIVFPKLLQVHVGISPFTYYKQMMPALKVGLLYLFLIGGLSFVKFQSFRAFFLAAVANTLVFLVIAALLVPEAKETIRRRFARRKGTPSEPVPPEPELPEPVPESMSPRSEI